MFKQKNKNAYIEWSHAFEDQTMNKYLNNEKIFLESIFHFPFAL